MPGAPARPSCKVEQFRDVPQFASKLAVESAMREFGVPHTLCCITYRYGLLVAPT